MLTYVRTVYTCWFDYMHTYNSSTRVWRNVCLLWWMNFISSETTITLVYLGHINPVGARQIARMYSQLMRAIVGLKQSLSRDHWLVWPHHESLVCFTTLCRLWRGTYSLIWCQKYRCATVCILLYVYIHLQYTINLDGHEFTIYNTLIHLYMHAYLIYMCICRIIAMRTNAMSSDQACPEIQMRYIVHVYVFLHAGYQTGHAYPLLMRADKLKTAAVQGALACLAQCMQTR